MRLNGFDDRLHALHHVCKVPLYLRALHAEFLRALGVREKFCRTNQRLRWHATGIQTVAAHLVLFNQGDFGFDGGGDVRSHQTCRTRANHNHILVESFRLQVVPFCIDLARLNRANDPFGQDRQNRQEHKRTDDAGRQNALERIDLGQLRARVHEHRCAQNHAKLRDPVEGPGFEFGQAEGQVDDEKRNRRNHANREEIERPVFRQTVVDALELVAELGFHRVAQQVARCQKGERRADGGGERGHDSASDHAKNRSACHGGNRRARQRERRHDDVADKVDGERLNLVRFIVSEDHFALGFERGEVEVLPDIEIKKCTNRHGDYGDKYELSSFHAGLPVVVRRCCAMRRTALLFTLRGRALAGTALNSNWLNWFRVLALRLPAPPARSDTSGH